MQIFTNLQEIPSLQPPSGLTIGTFDGVHLGHLALFKALRAQVTAQGSLTVLTFSNHPADLFAHRAPSPLLTTTEHKLKLLENAGINVCIIIPFTQEFANQPFSPFLIKLKEQLSMTHLLLGVGASFGKDRQGDESQIRALAQQFNFRVEYLPKALVDNEPISSGRIRNHLVKGEFTAVERLLGRPYSIYAPLVQEHGHLYLKAPGLCLPPDGIYPIKLCDTHETYLGRIHIDKRHETLRVDLAHGKTPSFQSSKPLAETIFLN
ncbi:MAG: FAD synthetase family protein [Rhabdochlamydiaceae bacterium]|nr:FAD synthetase family protein [Rhabdochlamydiaceae bacterium]